MYRRRLASLAFVMMTIAVTDGASRTVKGQGRPDPTVTIAAQREAMLQLVMMDGVWRDTDEVKIVLSAEGAKSFPRINFNLSLSNVSVSYSAPSALKVSYGESPRGRCPWLSHLALWRLEPCCNAREIKP